jgi:hypothetical protein
MVSVKMGNKDVPDLFKAEVHFPEADLCPFTAID